MRPRNRKSLGLVYSFGFILLVTASTSIHFDSDSAQPSTVHSVIVSIVEPLHRLMTDSGGELRKGLHAVSDSKGILEKNNELNRRVTELETEREKMRAVEEENDKLRNLLAISQERKDLRLRMARVSRKSSSAFSRIIGLELDSADGIAPGMPVIASGGLVGQIRDIVNGKPQVLLVTDARSAVDVILETSRTRGIAVGSGDQRTYRTELKYVDRSESAIDGERVLTTGDDERFNEGLYVGTVRLDPKAPRRQITVLPAVRFEELDLVYIVLGTTGLTPDGRRYRGRKR